VGDEQPLAFCENRAVAHEQCCWFRYNVAFMVLLRSINQDSGMGPRVRTWLELSSNPCRLQFCVPDSWSLGGVTG
jgi:hypothetical protein